MLSVVAIIEATLEGKSAIRIDTTEIQAKLSVTPITILRKYATARNPAMLLM